MVTPTSAVLRGNPEHCDKKFKKAMRSEAFLKALIHLRYR